MRLSSNDIIGLIAILIMLIGSSMISYYLIVEKINDCTSDPLRFTAEKLVGEQEYNYIYLGIYKNRNDLFPIERREIYLSNYSIK